MEWPSEWEGNGEFSTRDRKGAPRYQLLLGLGCLSEALGNNTTVFCGGPEVVDQKPGLVWGGRGISTPGLACRCLQCKAGNEDLNFPETKQRGQTPALQPWSADRGRTPTASRAGMPESPRQPGARGSPTRGAAAYSRELLAGSCRPRPRICAGRGPQPSRSAAAAATPYS